MTLIFHNGEPFATGSLKYFYGPATIGETTNRIILPVAALYHVEKSLLQTSNLFRSGF